MKIMTVVGARPQFIKAAAVSRVIRKNNTEILVHTGQHYDGNMSGIFFDELGIPRPDYNLGVGSASHGRQTGLMLLKIEELLYKEKPDMMLVYGDTNSTLAGALAAAKLLIPVAHVEAGLRSYDRAMPEEQNRVLTDHLSSLLFCPTEAAVENLAKEGITQGVFKVGDVQYDALLYYSAIAKKQGGGFGALKYILPKPGEIAGDYYLATIHRAENTDGERNLQNILAGLSSLPAPVIFPVHPRTRPIIEEIAKKIRLSNIHFVEPVGYISMLRLLHGAKKVITDSGGLQKEAYMLGTACVTVREETEWVETLRGGWNVLARPDADDISEKVRSVRAQSAQRGDYYGDGHAAERICRIIQQFK